MTITEMADKLKLPYKTVAQRIVRGGYKPKFTGNLYAVDVFEAISNVKPKGWSRKNPAKEAVK